MTALRSFLLVSTVTIFLLTFVVSVSSGINWPAVAVSDLLALNWRSQFNTDLITHLLLLATWISWREGFTTRGFTFGFLSIVMGGMFSFPYLLHATYVSRGDPKKLLLGSRAQ